MMATISEPGPGWFDRQMKKVSYIPPRIRKFDYEQTLAAIEKAHEAMRLVTQRINYLEKQLRKVCPHASVVEYVPHFDRNYLEANSYWLEKERVCQKCNITERRNFDRLKDDPGRIIRQASNQEFRRHNEGLLGYTQGW